MVSTGLLNAIVTGLVTGSVVALGAIGLSLVYRIADVPNFAHGELLMLGAYAAFIVNTPGTVPGYKLLVAGEQDASVLALALLFAVTATAFVAILWMLGGDAFLAGGWWPIDVSARAGYLGTAVMAAVVAGIVVVSTPSIVGGMLFAIIVMAALAPLQETIVYRKFRDKDVDLGTMLIVALGVSFFLRFTTQAVFGADLREYVVPSIAQVGTMEIPLAAAQRFNIFVTDELVFEMINTGAPSQEPSVVGVIGYSWPMVAAILGGALLVGSGVGLVRQRRGDPVFDPRLTGSLAGIIALAVGGYLLAGSASVPTSWIYATQVSLSLMRGLVIVIAVAMMAVLHVLLQETKLGTAMRAASDNLDLARVTGIDTDGVMMATWIIAGAYAAIGGVLVGILFVSITPNIGFFLLLPMFAGVILGGVGSVYGAILGSYLVGLSMDVGLYVFSMDTTYRIPLAFVVLFIVLLVKPEGLTGGR